jgi:hypothetical protein
VTRSMEKGVVPLFFSKKVGFKLYIMIFIDFLSSFERFWFIFLGSWAPFEARSWGEVGILLPTSILYKPKVLEAMEGGSEQENVEELLSQSHFYAGKPLRRAPLQAISGIFVHLISVPSVFWVLEI